MADSARLRGWKWDGPNGYLEVWVCGTNIARFDNATNDLQLLGCNGMTIDAGGLTVTAGGATVTAGGLTVTACSATLCGTGVSMAIDKGFFQSGNPGTFACTQMQGGIVMGGSSLCGVAPVGAITTAGGLFASDTVVRKIIAAGTASNVET